MNGREYMEQERRAVYWSSEVKDMVSTAFEAGIDEGIFRNQVTEPKPDRRAELLEMAGKLAVAYISAPKTPKEKSKEPTRLWLRPFSEVRKEEAEGFTADAAAILDAVDRSVGAKQDGDALNQLVAMRDETQSQIDFDAWWTREGHVLASRNPTQQSQHDIAKAAWEAARR